MKKVFFLAPLLTLLVLLTGCSSQPSTSAPTPAPYAPPAAQTTPPVPNTTTPPTTTVPPTTTDTTVPPTAVTPPPVAVPVPPATSSDPAAKVTPPVAQTVRVTAQNFAFNPATVNIKVGDKVSWTNQDSMNHTITSAGNFDSGNLSTGQSFSFTFKTAGTYDYHCSIHPSMTGKIVVVQ